MCFALVLSILKGPQFLCYSHGKVTFIWIGTCVYLVSSVETSLPGGRLSFFTVGDPVSDQAEAIC